MAEIVIALNACVTMLLVIAGLNRYRVMADVINTHTRILIALGVAKEKTDDE